MKVLVTGGEGFIGRHLVKHLLEEGHYVTSLDNRTESDHRNEMIPGCVYYIADVENIERVLSGQNFDMIYHLAALSRIQPSFETPNEFFKSNTEGTQAVCEFARKQQEDRKHPVKVVYAGSSSRWQTPTISPYATYKFLGEEICKMYRKVYSLNIHIARFYNVYGPGELVEGDYAAVIGRFRRGLEKPDGSREVLQIVGTGHHTRDFTHVGDIIEGLTKLITYPLFPSNSFEWEFGTRVEYSINEVAEMFKKHHGCIFEHKPDEKGNYVSSVRHNDTAVRELGWQPTDRLESYIKSL